jgi:hypothetical protein
VAAVRLATLGLGGVGTLAALLIVVSLVISALSAIAGREARSVPISLLMLALCAIILAARLAVALPGRGLVARLGGPGRVRQLALLALGLIAAATLAQLISSIVAILSGS